MAAANPVAQRKPKLACRAAIRSGCGRAVTGPPPVGRRRVRGDAGACHPPSASQVVMNRRPVQSPHRGHVRGSPIGVPQRRDYRGPWSAFSIKRQSYLPRLRRPHRHSRIWLVRDGPRAIGVPGQRAPPHRRPAGRSRRPGTSAPPPITATANGGCRGARQGGRDAHEVGAGARRFRGGPGARLALRARAAPPQAPAPEAGATLHLR
jgi:hypothetical protein